jgi:hypothetical protein
MDWTGIAIAVVVLLWFVFAKPRGHIAPFVGTRRAGDGNLHDCAPHPDSAGVQPDSDA